MGQQMIKVLLLLLISSGISGCAQDLSPRHVRCAPFFKTDAEGKRINGYMDLERDVELDISQCDEIVVR